MEPLDLTPPERIAATDPVEDSITLKTYTLASTAWAETVWKHSPNIVDDLGILLHTSLGWDGEIKIVFHRFSNGETAAQLCVFDTSWEALTYLQPLLDRLCRRDGQISASPEEFIAELKALGFTPSENHGQFVPETDDPMKADDDYNKPTDPWSQRTSPPAQKPQARRNAGKDTPKNFEDLFKLLQGKGDKPDPFDDFPF